MRRSTRTTNRPASGRIALSPSRRVNSVTYLGDAVPSPTSPPLSVAAVFQVVGDDAALADYMGQAVQKFPDDERGYEFLMNAQDRLGRVVERKATAAKLVALLTKKVQHPGAQDLPRLTDTLAEAYWVSGDPVNGAAQFKKEIGAYPALKSYPDDYGPYNGLAYAEAEANVNLPEALSMAQTALKLAQGAARSDEEIAAVQDTLGWVQYRMGDYQNARQNLQEAVNVDPREPEMRYHLGMVYAAQGQTDAARAELTHAVLLAPGYAAPKQALETLPKSVAASSALR